MKNMGTVINIPNVERDERIGSAFNHLFTLIYKIENADTEKVKWNFKETSFFHPFFLAIVRI